MIHFILTMILTLGGGSSTSPAVAIHTQEYSSIALCEEAKKKFLDADTKTVEYEKKQAYCVKK